MSVTVAWQGKKHDVQFPEAYAEAKEDWPSRVTLGELMERCARNARIPTDRCRLIYGGATMKDPSLPLSKYGIKNGAKILMVGDNSGVPSHPPPPHAADRRNNQQQTPNVETRSGPDESDMIKKVESHVENARRTLVPMIEDYSKQAVEFLGAGNDQATSALPTAKQLKDSHAKISELLLQSLLKLDGVTCPPDFEAARASRKEAVRFVQSLLDRVDGIRDRVNAAAQERVPARV
ncbi:hypothetical protein HK104_011083 [Borealophlyctis nickersoniae]|nr:hypothetical protein HK104_011083 [Borealophlyctis nickersoniae]